MHGEQKGWARLMRATGVSILGLRRALQEPAFRIELGCLSILGPLALWLGRNGAERAILVASLFAVLVTEILNTAIEMAVDRIGPERHSLSAQAKDLGSAAVMLSLVQVPLVWMLVLSG